MTRGWFALALLLLAACSGGSSSTSAAPGEDKALDEAAAALDANAADTNAAMIIDADENGTGDDNASERR